MLIKKVIYEEFTDYKKPHMFIAMPRCYTFKCDVCNGKQVCQNAELTKAPDLIVDIDKVIQKYLSNNLTQAIVFGGLEPLDTFEELLQFIDTLRNRYRCNDTVVIYTGYNKDEVEEEVMQLMTWPNIIIKFGRYILNKLSRYDELLGVTLASDNQYAVQIS